MKKLVLYLLLVTGMPAIAQVKLSQPQAGQLQIIDQGITATYNTSTLYYKMDSTSVDGRVGIYQNGTVGSVAAVNSNNYILNGVPATTPQSVRDQLYLWGVAKAPSGSGGGGGGGGDASAANQVTGNSLLNQINTKTPALGQSAMATSQPVVIANNQTAIPVTGSFYQTTQPVSLASSPLPTGAATAANQSTEIASLSTITTNTTRQAALYTPQSTSLTTTPTALTTAAAVLIEIKNNAVGAVDITVSKAGGTSETVPAGAVVRFDGITNANQLSVAASAGTPTVFYRLYTQLSQ